MDADHSHFEIESRPGKRPGQHIIQISGRLVFDTTQRFTNFVRKENAPIVILDLSDLIDLDSTGLGTLMRTHESFKRQKQHLALVGINEKVRHVLEITSVLRLLTVFETLAE